MIRIEERRRVSTAAFSLLPHDVIVEWVTVSFIYADKDPLHGQGGGLADDIPAILFSLVAVIVIGAGKFSAACGTDCLFYIKDKIIIESVETLVTGELIPPRLGGGEQEGVLSPMDDADPHTAADYGAAGIPRASDAAAEPRGKGNRLQWHIGEIRLSQRLQECSEDALSAIATFEMISPRPFTHCFCHRFSVHA